MIQTILFFTNSTLLLLFGVFLSSSFSGNHFSKKHFLILLAFCSFSGILQLIAYGMFEESVVWKIYPVITHLPLLILLCTVYRKRITTAVVSIATAYLCCQPAKWFGVLIFSITHNTAAQYAARIIILVVVAVIALGFLTPYLSEIFNKDTRSICIFGTIPAVYYVFDYLTVIYTDFWTSNNRVAAEFLPFFLSIVFMIFCVVYYKEYEQKSDAERKEQIIRITLDQQAKEIEAVKRSEQEIRILRHDLRILLTNISMCIENDDKDTARKLIAAYVDNVDATALQKYCSNTTINYIISAYAARCKELDIEFLCEIELGRITCDEIMLSTIISNALDNAFNAQKTMPKEKRRIKLMLKTHDGKTLLSVKNPIQEKPIFADGMPVSNRKGHGYGSQSISYLVERMGGNCQFTIDDNHFVLRVVIT